jgi:Fic family protein
MTGDDAGDHRHSRALSPDLIDDPDELARREAANGLRQFDAAMAMLEDWRSRASAAPFRLRLSTILHLHRVALEGISAFAGNFRPAGVEIEGSDHRPVDAWRVPSLVEELCDYVNENWNDRTAIHLAAYVLWRLNWIHPFDDGNGRTSRILSYLVLCARLDARLPGANTIPDQIASNKSAYYRALEDADRSWKDSGLVDVSRLEELLEGLLASQLVQLLEDAKGTPL